MPATTKIEEVKEEPVKSVDVNALKTMSICHDHAPEFA